MRRFARGLARDADAADDLVQACLERALAKEALYDPQQSLRTWLFTILRNLFITTVRQRRSFACADHGDAAGPRDVPLAPAQLDTVMLRQVFSALECLSDEHREVLLLVAVEELSYREAAEILGVPIGTVMSRLARARERLSSLLQENRQPHLKRVK